MGWTQLGNGALLRAADLQFDIFITTEIYGFNKILPAIGWDF